MLLALIVSAAMIGLGITIYGYMIELPPPLRGSAPLAGASCGGAGDASGKLT